MKFRGLRDVEMAAEFEAFHARNPQVYRLVCRFALEAIGAGRKRLAIAALFERIRWYVNVETRGEPFKLNNNHRAFYARLFEKDHPKHAGFFAMRRSATDPGEGPVYVADWGGGVRRVDQGSAP